MEWLKKHWEVLAAIAAGILVLYFILQNRAANAANAANTASDQAIQTQPQVEYGGYAYNQPAESGVVDQSQPVTNSSSATGTISPSAPAGTITATPTTSGDVNMSDANPNDPYAQYLQADGQYNFPSGGPPGVTPVANPNVSSSGTTFAGTLGATINTAANTLLGANPPAAPVHADPVPVTKILPPFTNIPPVDSSNGTIPQHDTILPTPSRLVLASLGSSTS